MANSVSSRGYNMAQVIEFDGQEYEFPDDATNDEILGMLSTVEQPTPAKIPDKPLINTQGDVSQLHAENKAIRKDEGAVRNKEGQHVAYNDSKGFPTGGIGHLLTKEEKETYPEGAEIPDEIANAWFAEDMDEAVGGVDRMLEDRKVDLPEAAYDILVNMTFNMGRGGVENFTKMWDALEIGDYETAAAEMEDSDWFKDVGNRAVRLIDRMLAIPNAKPKDKEVVEESASAEQSTVSDLTSVKPGLFQDDDGNLFMVDEKGNKTEVT